MGVRWRFYIGISNQQKEVMSGMIRFVWPGVCWDIRVMLQWEGSQRGGWSGVPTLLALTPAGPGSSGKSCSPTPADFGAGTEKAGCLKGASTGCLYIGERWELSRLGHGTLHASVHFRLNCLSSSWEQSPCASHHQNHLLELCLESPGPLEAAGRGKKKKAKKIPPWKEVNN